MFFRFKLLSLLICSSLVTVSTVQQSHAGKLGKALGVAGGLLILGKVLSDAEKDKQKNKNRSNSNRSSYSSSSSSYSSKYRTHRVDDVVIDQNDIANRRAIQKRQENFRLEQKRNVLLAVDDFIVRLKSLHHKLKLNGGGSNRKNQVTQGEIERVVDDAYKLSKLYMFDRFSGEIWTRERLKVQIINEAKKGLPPFFNGVGAQGPSMQDLTYLFQKSAKTVQGRALEISEIIGVSHSFERFIRAIYQNSDRVPESLMVTGADGYYERILSNVINLVPRGHFIQDRPNQPSDHWGLQNQFQFRFRARRVLYDCLTNSYVDVMSGKKTGQINVKNRGATLSNIGNGASEGKVVEAAVVIPSVWRRTEKFLHDGCGQMVKRWSIAAVSGGIRPVPKRWDGAAPKRVVNNRPWEQGGPIYRGNHNGGQAGAPNQQRVYNNPGYNNRAPQQYGQPGYNQNPYQQQGQPNYNRPNRPQQGYYNNQPNQQRGYGQPQYNNNGNYAPNQQYQQGNNPQQGYYQRQGHNPQGYRPNQNNGYQNQQYQQNGGQQGYRNNYQAPHGNNYNNNGNYQGQPNQQRQQNGRQSGYYNNQTPNGQPYGGKKINAGLNQQN